MLSPQWKRCPRARGTCPQRPAEVSLSRRRASQPPESSCQCLSRSSPRGDSARLAATKQPAWPHAPVWGLWGNRVPLDPKKVAQLPALSTTLLAPDPEDAASPTREWDERCSFGLKKSGSGWPCVPRRDRWSPLGWVSGANRGVNGCGRPWHQPPAKGTAKPPSGRHSRLSSLRSNREREEKRRAKPPTCSAAITRCGSVLLVLSP